MTETQPMQADGGNQQQGRSDGVGDTATHGKQASESQGGAYPADRPAGSFEGGQSRKAYHGSGQLGEDKTDANENAPATGD